MNGELDYWRDRSADLPALELPTDRPYTPNRLTEVAAVGITAAAESVETVEAIGFGVPASTAQRLRTLADDHGATLPQTLLAALMVLIARYTGSDDVAVAAGAQRPGVTVHRADLSGDPSFAALLEQIRRGEAGGQDLLSEETLAALAAERSGSRRNPLFRLYFGYAGPEAEGLQALSGELEAQFDVAVRVRDSGEGGLAGEVRYSTALFDATTVERLAGHLVAVMEAVAAGAAADAGLRVGELSVLAAGECERLVAGGEGGFVELPAVGGVHELIAERAVVAPDAVAVVAGGESVTYGGLMARANRLARHLRSVGVGAESVVGLCLPRG
ncbi:condensation domain-containing protein, partial [Streptomyces sp. NPDC048629]|uniref:condensation domain-containing protein n=1 Tax=Streptomyces sp. NPDC048629 TaxID=3154824 RepID=UPI0034315663